MTKRGRPKKSANNIGDLPKVRGGRKQPSPDPTKPPRGKTANENSVISSASAHGRGDPPVNSSAVVVVPKKNLISNSISLAMHTPKQLMPTELVTPTPPANPLVSGAEVLTTYFSLKRLEQVEAHKTRLEMLDQESKENSKTENMTATSQAVSHNLDAAHQDHRRSQQVM
jgi:hypothetical protein